MQVNLVYFKSTGGRRDIPLTKDNVVVGRGLDCDVQAPQIGVSRRHCELVATDEGLKVRDLGSSNGTYLNGERVDEHVVVAGDRLQVGSVVLTVQIDGQPAEVAPPAAAPAKKKKAPAPAAEGVSTDDEIFAQMMMDEDEDEDDDEIVDLGDPISALDVLQEDDED